MIASGVTREEILSWGGPEVFAQGMAIVNAGDVLSVEYDDDTVTISGRIARPDGWGMPVSLKLREHGRIESHCPCYRNQRLGQVCAHVVALGIAQMVLESDSAGDGTAGDAAPPPAARAAAPGEHGREPSGGDADADPEAVEMPATPGFCAYLSGSRAALSATVDAWYGEVDIPACSVQDPRVVRLVDASEPGIVRVRSMEAERAAVDRLREWGFEYGSRGVLKLFLTDSRKVLNFLASGIGELRRSGWRVDLSERLEATLDGFGSVVSVVRIRDGAAGGFFVRYGFESGGREIPPAEIQAAINRGDGFIDRADGTVLFDSQTIGMMTDVFRDCVGGGAATPDGFFGVRAVHAPFVRASLAALADVVELDDSEAPRWRRESAAAANARFEPVALGALEHVLRPYQKQGVYWMRFQEESGVCGLLADEMGLGKTLQTLAWLSLRRTDGARAPALIVCPTSLVMNWVAEARRFTPGMKVVALSGPDRGRRFGDVGECDLAVTSYALLQRDFDALWSRLEFSALVIDEAQHIKNRQTKNAQTVKLVRCRTRLALTGTPVENGVADVWSIFDFLMPGYLGDYESFRLSCEEPVLAGGAAGERALARLKRKLSPFMLRREKKTVAADLPDKIEKVSYCPMDDDAQREYVAALSKARVHAGELVRAKGLAKAKFELLALLTKLRQIAAAAKLPAFLEQLESALAGGHKVLVFSQFVGMLKLIAAELQRRGIVFCYLDGSTRDRLGECDRFNRDPSVGVFLISLMAGGTGLNLVSADMVVHYDPWWNPAVENQATDRAHRIGQKKTVYVVKMIASGSVEEKVLALQARKRAVIAATVATSDAAVMEKLTAEDLRELFAEG